MVVNYFRAFLHLNDMLKSAYWSKEKILKEQNSKMKTMVRYAYDNVPFYHDIMKLNNLYPEDFKDLKDINKLPIIKKDDIRNNYKDFISKKFNPERLIQISTSGSTGKPLFLKIDHNEDEIRKAKFLRSHISLGHRPWDKWVIITSPHHFGSDSNIQRLLNFYVPNSVSVFDPVEVQVEKIRSLKADVLDGYSSSLYLLAKYLDDENISGISPKFLIGGAELIDEVSRKFVEDVFCVPFYDQYACIEFERIAWECPDRMGYHIDADSLIVQFVDDAGNEVSSGESGEIICTSLFNFAMPLIRYSVGDMGIPSGEECTCGRGLPLMNVMEGRTDSLLMLPNGRIISPRSFTVAMSSFEYYPFFSQFRIIQKKRSLFHIKIKLHNENIDKDMISRKLVNYLSNTLSLDLNNINFEVYFVDNIPLDKTGKLKIVISELDEKDLR